MAIANEDGMNVAGDQYKDSFAEDAPITQEPSEDEAFGITPPAEAVAAAEAAEPVVEPVAAEPEMAGAVAEPAAVSETDQNAVATAPVAESDEPTDPKEIQRKASWEGRLKKMEAELMAKMAASKAEPEEILEAVGDKADAAGKTDLGEAADQVAEQVEAGTLSPEQAMARLSEDFGDDFVTMVKAVVMATASDVSGKAVAAVRGDVDEIVSHISDSTQKAHFKAIASAHPDFNDVSTNPAFKEFVAGAGEDAQRIATSGSADEVIQLISDYKAKSAPAPAPEPAAEAAAEPAPSPAGQEGPEGADAALGVRSGGLRLPDEPASTDDFEGAWNEAAKSK